MGIPPELLPNIFDLFTQADRTLSRSEGGLGVGLTLVKRLVDIHGGQVEARSEGAGKGSEFIVMLPLAGSKSEAQTDDPGPTEETPVVSRRVLIVDDNVDAAESMSMLVQLLGHDVRTAYDGLEALSTAREFRPEVVLLDIGLPELDGFQVARELRSGKGGYQPALIAALTGYGQEKDKKKIREAGIDEHLVKPVHLSDLEKLLAREAPASS